MTPVEQNPHFHPEDPIELMEIRIKLMREIAELCKKLPADRQPEAVQYILLGRRLGREWPPVEFFQRALEDTRQQLAALA